MTESVLQGQIVTAPPNQIRIWISRLVWKMAIATLLLIAVGSATRVMNAGLACPDWPLCYGQLVPAAEMNLQVFLEWFHRLDAALIGISAISLVGLSWWYRSHLPRWMLAASIFALFCIVFQGILGALTVTQLLRFDIVTAHLGTALFFFSTLIAIATCLTPVGKKLAIPKIWWLALTAAILVYLQCLLGGLVASRWALHQCFGASQLCGVMNGHILGVVPPTLAIFVLAWFAWQTRKIAAIFWKLSFLAIGLVGVQTCLGIATFKLHLQVEPLTVAHETVGASLLGLLVAFSVVSIRDRFSTPTN